jgi:hypothetical protein
MLVALFCTVAHAASETWEPAYDGADPSLLYLPDANAVYWRYGWERNSGDKTGLIITGKMPNARYFSYNVYNDEIKSSLGSVTDYEIAPENGAVNPYSGTDQTGNPDYTIHVLPEGTKTDAKNVLYFPDNITKVSVFLRHYVPAGGPEGGVPLPTIQNFNPSTNEASTAAVSTKIPKLSKAEAKKYLMPVLGKLVKQFESNPQAVIDKLHKRDSNKTLDIKELVATQVISNAFKFFQPGKLTQSFRFQTEGTYPNKDNHYLGLPIIRTSDEVLVTKFKAPNYPKSRKSFSDTQVRYFSIGQGDEHSYNKGSDFDQDMTINEDGNIYYIIGDANIGLEEKAKQMGANFMKWNVGKQMLLIYRHMLPASDFASGIDKVPSFKPGSPAGPQAASNFISEYAITGKLFDKSDILNANQIPSLAE